MFVDSHTHVTWGIDDGLQTFEECKEALSMYKEDGIHRIIATPHFIPGTSTSEIKENIARMIEVQQLASSLGITYYPGSEVMLNSKFRSMFESKSYFTLANSKYVLVEFNVREELGDFDAVEERLYACFDYGLIPVVAHVERYFHEGIDIERVREWVDMGCMIQVNRTSILGLQGKTIQKNALELLDRRFVHIVASDAHRINGSRIPKLSDVFAVLKKRYGEENAMILTHYNPIHIIENKELEEMVPVVKKRHFFFR